MTETRTLPDFVVIGAPRAGTTSLYEALSQIDEICLTEFKEPNYFISELNWPKGAHWYRSLFAEPDKICGDISPNYSSVDKFEGVADRLHAASPDAKIIYNLRDPVKRAISHYQQNWLAGQTAIEPQQFFDTADGAHILNGSRYWMQLQPYLERFPEDNFHFVDFRDLRQRQKDVVAEICRFVGCPQKEGSLAELSTEHRNSTEALSNMPGWYMRASEWVRTNDSRLIRRAKQAVPSGAVQAIKSVVSSPTDASRRPPAVSEEVRERMREVLAEDAARFREFTGKAFSHWSV